MHELTSVPRYLASFTCVGPSCPDTCCSGWNIHVDAATNERWQTIRLHEDGPPLAARTRQVRADENHGDGVSALVHRAPGGDCAWLTDEKLCAVQSQLGETALPLTCHTYPRSLVKTVEHVSMFLSLGCPQAARLALADARAMDMVPPQQQPAGRLPALQSPHGEALATLDQFAASTSDGIHAAADMLAQAAQGLMRAPELTVWQAWALYWQKAMGVLAALTSGSDKRAAAEQLCALQQLARRSEGLLPTAKLAEESFVARALPMPGRLDDAFGYACDIARGVQNKFSDPKRKTLTQALALSHAMAPYELGDNPEPAAMAAARERYEHARREWFEPFDNSHRHLLKNHLRNRLALRGFPRCGMQRFGEELAHEAMDLDVLRVFLVGQAMAKRSEFGIDDYVVLVQAFTRHVVHPMDADGAMAPATRP
jgi:lysine-N-methylase